MPVCHVFNPALSQHRQSVPSSVTSVVVLLCTRSCVLPRSLGPFHTQAPQQIGSGLCPPHGSTLVTLPHTPWASRAPRPAWVSGPVWGSTPTAHVVSEKPAPRFCRISKTPLHSQLAKLQHSNVTRDQVLLEQNMTFHINFHSASPFCRAQPGGVGGGEDGACHPACLGSFLGCRGTQTRWESNSLVLPSSPAISILPQEQGRGLLPACFLHPKPFCLCRSSSA